MGPGGEGHCISQAQKGHSACAEWPLGLKVCRAVLLEGSDGAGLVVVDIEDGVKLGQLQ
jgi:hypothetical protein